MKPKLPKDAINPIAESVNIAEFFEDIENQDDGARHNLSRATMLWIWEYIQNIEAEYRKLLASNQQLNSDINDLNGVGAEEQDDPDFDRRW